jgi:NAD(P)-dependent dehydrogenase (short-subunit alcohol dehydrogenase family)
MENKNIFVVGGSSGIGLEIVKRLAADGHEVYVGSRNDRALAGIAEAHRNFAGNRPNGGSFAKRRRFLDYRPDFSCGWGNVFGEDF